VALGRTSGGAELGTFNVTEPSKVWTDLQPGQVYFVKVRANVGTSVGAWSSSVPMTMAVVIESRSTGYENGWYNDSNLSDSTAKSTAAGLIGAGSRYAVNHGIGSTGFAAFHPAIAKSGVYEIWTTWPADASVLTAGLRYTIIHKNGTTEVFKDQEGPVNGNQWISLGFYEFDAGTTGTTVTADNSMTTSTDGGTNTVRFYVDSIKYVWAPAPTFTNATDYSTFTGGTTTWEAVPGATSYDIALGSTWGGEEIVAPTNVTATSYVWSGLTPGQTYYEKLHSRVGHTPRRWKVVPMTLGTPTACTAGQPNGVYSDDLGYAS